MKRHRPVLPPHGPLNHIVPEAGMGVQIYMSRKDVGSGTRPYLIIGVNRLWVTLYYTPRLLAIRIKRNLWEYLPAVPYQIDAVYLAQRIRRNIALFRRTNMRFSKAYADRALKVLHSTMNEERDDG